MRQEKGVYGLRIRAFFDNQVLCDLIQWVRNHGLRHFLSFQIYVGAVNSFGIQDPSLLSFKKLCRKGIRF
jgi:hypothetical protein